jgi:ATP-binding cassette subfamily F protein 3
MYALREYDGTLLVVSHDRHFVSAVGTRVLAIAPGGLVEDFAGDYEEYLERRGEDYLAASSARRRPRRGSGSGAGADSGRAAQRERERGAAKLTRAVEGYEREVGELEARVAELETRFTAPGYYERTPRERIDADGRQQSELRERLATQLAAWERAAADLEALQPASSVHE